MWKKLHNGKKNNAQSDYCLSAIVHEFETLLSVALFMDKPSIQELITSYAGNS